MIKSIGISIGVVCAFLLTANSAISAAPDTPVPAKAFGTRPSSGQLIDEVQHRAFLFFWNESDPATGLTKDRAGNFAPDTYTIASIASTGYALSALPIGVEHGWISKKAAYGRALNTLRFVHDKLPNNHGWYYHFIDQHTGDRQWNCELSSIDTALLMLGALTVGQYFRGSEVQRLANSLYDNMDFPWMQTEGGSKPDQVFLSMGWKPESGWIENGGWSDFNEDPELYFLAMGSRTHPISAEAWHRLALNPSQVEGYEVLRGAGPLFIWQMPPGYFDYRGKRDWSGYDFWVNSVNAHLANHAFCVRNSGKYKTYSDTVWGVTASDEPPPNGYGAQDDADGKVDGTVAPTAEITSILFIPGIGRSSLNGLYAEYADKLWGRYGFSNAFNVDKNWYDKDVIGIDLGMTIIALEDYRTGLIWRLMGQTPAGSVGMARAGFALTNEPNPRPLHASSATAKHQ